jgi:hypothetical protein
MARGATSLSAIALGCVGLLATACTTKGNQEEPGHPALAGTADGGAALANVADGSVTLDARVDAPSDAGVSISTTSLASRCDPSHAWAPAKRIASLATSSATTLGRFGGISRDELKVAWTSAAGGIYVSARNARAADFGSPIQVATSSTPVADGDRVALAPDGVELYAVAAARTTFIVFDGSSGSWSASPTSALRFANINAMITETHGLFSEPVLGADGNSFFFLLTPTASGAPSSLYESKWNAQQHVWATGTVLPNPELTSNDPMKRHRATAASSDGRTLFFFDETAGASGQERAAWRASATAPFTQFADVSGMFEAAPNYRCDTLYYQGSDSMGPGVFIAQ